MKRLGTFILVVAMAVGGLASPGGAGGATPPPDEEQGFCPDGGIHVPLEVDLDSETDVLDQLDVGEDTVFDEARVEVKKNVLIELCVFTDGDVLPKVTPAVDVTKDVTPCPGKQNQTQVLIGLDLEVAAGIQGGKVVIKDQVVASDHDFIMLDADGKVVVEKPVDAEVRIEDRYEIAVPPLAVAEKKQIRHRTCIGVRAGK